MKKFPPLPKSRKVNNVEILGKVAWLELTKGRRTQIDAEDLGRVAAFRWSVSLGAADLPYARSASAGEQIALHRLIVDAPKGMDVDHINGDTLDNRKANLRVCEHSENCRNQKARASHGLKGITKNIAVPHRPWAAVLHLGHFHTKELAAKAYDRAVKLLFGKFARLNYALLLAGLLTGCGLIPHRVEFFQDKVHKFPQPTAKQEELQREAAAMAKQKAAVVVDEALKENASLYVLSPAREAEKLTDAVSTSLGPPVSPANDTTNVVAKLNKAVAKHDNKVQSFAQENDKDAGKKIEGTGLLQVPYFAYAGGVIGFILLVWVVLRAVLSAASAANPGAAVAVGGMNVAQSVLAKGFHQMVSGGETFKYWIKHEISDPALQQKVLGAFRANHITAQDEDVQAVVKQLTK